MNNNTFQSVPEEKAEKVDTFPTTTMNTVVGDAKVANKSYSVQGDVVDSQQDTPIDVNAMYNVTPPAQNAPSTGYSQIFEKPIEQNDESKSGNKNPQQSFLPSDHQEDS